MIKTEVAFLEGRLLSSQSEQFKKNSNSSDWKKVGPPKNHFCFDHVNRLYCKKCGIFLNKMQKISLKIPYRYREIVKNEKISLTYYVNDHVLRFLGNENPSY